MRHIICNADCETGPGMIRVNSRNLGRGGFFGAETVTAGKNADVGQVFSGQCRCHIQIKGFAHSPRLFGAV